MTLVRDIQKNITTLSEAMDGTKAEIEKYEDALHNHADTHFKDNDHYTDYDQAQKSQLFDDTIAEFEKSLGMMVKKFDKLHIKVDEMNYFTEHFSETTDKLEALYYEDIEFRKKYYQEHTVVKAAISNFGEESGYDLSQINDIFDEIEKEETKSLASMFISLSNISMMGVIIMSAYVYNNIAKMGSKKRFD